MYKCSNYNWVKHGEAYRQMSLRWSYIRSIRRASLARELPLYWLQKEHRRWICDDTFFKEKQVVQLSGKTSSFQYNADSGNSKIKFFCQRCGSFVFGTNSGREGIMTIYVGTLDDASFVKPQFNVYTSRALPYVKIDESLNNFEKGRQ